MGTVSAAALSGVLLAGLVLPVGATAETGATAAARKPCITSKKVIARHLRQEDAYPVVRGMRRRDVVACRGRWALITRSWMGDASFNARYRRGRWHFNAGYPMGPCGRTPDWLCPTHP